MSSTHSKALGLVLTLAAVVSGCEPAPREVPLGATASAARPPVSSAASGALPRLVFFKNPAGAPCQFQQKILDGLTPQLAGKVAVVVYETTSAADLAQFDAYRIQGLPTLVLTDAGGRELRRSPSGIVAPQHVLALVDGTGAP